jgi:hypothetical protein
MDVFHLKNLQVMNEIKLILIFILIFFSCSPTNRARIQEFSRSVYEWDLAYKWAPIHYQDIDKSDGGSYSSPNNHALKGKSDLITSVNYDGDWNTLNNWENLKDFPAIGMAYYSVVSSETHDFILYVFYHPRDWANDCSWESEHENDFEGALVIVKKDNGTNEESSFGTLEGVITQAHGNFTSHHFPESDFKSLVFPLGIPTHSNSIITVEDFNNHPHPKTTQESKGHGCYAFPKNQPIGDGIKYIPTREEDEVEEPVLVEGNNNLVNSKYYLQHIFEDDGLWDHFQSYSSLPGNDGGGCGHDGGPFCVRTCDGSANLPWAWSNDVISGKGAIANDPIKLVQKMFEITGEFSSEYTHNPYTTSTELSAQ